MSGNREIEEQEAWSTEEDELIPRCVVHLYHEGHDDGTKITEDWRKGKRIMGVKKIVSHGNKRKMLTKAKQALFSPLRRLQKHVEATKENIDATSTRRCSYRFPYDGEEFGRRPSSYLCFGSPHPSTVASPVHLGTAYSNEAPSASSTAKPKPSSYYNFVKSLIEKNDFFSPDCNAHRDISTSSSK